MSANTGSNVGKIQQESNLPKLRGIQFDSSGGSVNLFRGTASFNIPLFTLPGLNGLEFQTSLFYQSDRATTDTSQWSLEKDAIAGAGWEMPYERILIEPSFNNTIEDNKYFWVMSGQPTQLLPINFFWECGLLSDAFRSELAPGIISPILLEALQEQQILISPEATLSQYGGSFSNWTLQDPTYEKSYQLVEQEDSILVQTGGRSYELYNYQYWRITYYPEFEKWEVIKDDGNLYIFGGSGTQIAPGMPANVCQYGIRWGNWIGPSIVAEGQVQYVKAWNLATVSNRIGNYYHINYMVENQNVGLGTLTYTKSCHVLQAKNDLGWSIVYGYEEKVYDASALEAPKEYLDPHKDPTQATGTVADAYQSSYNTYCLSELCIYAADESMQSYIRLKYHNFGTTLSPLYVGNLTPQVSVDAPDAAKLAYGATYQRYLESITQYTGESYGLPDQVLDRYSSPSIQFEYNLDKNTQPLGSLKRIINPTGGYTEFEYQELTLESDPRTIVVPNSWGDSPGTVRTWSGHDYTVCCWVNSTATSLKLRVLTWGGRWYPNEFENEETFLELQTPIDLEKLQVIPSLNTFALIVPSLSPNTPTPVYLFNRKKLETMSWVRDQNPLITLQSKSPKVAVGSDFFVVLDDDEVIEIYFYKWDTLTQAWEIESEGQSEAGVKCYICADERYFGALVYDPLAEAGHLIYRFLNEFNEWGAYSAIEIPHLCIPEFEGFSYCELAASKSFISMSFVTGYVADAPASFKAFDYEMKIFTWNDAYELSIVNMQDIENIESGRFKNIPLSLLNGPTGIGPINIQNAVIGTGPNHLRFDGQTWRCESVGITYEGFADLAHQYYWYDYDLQSIIASENTDSGRITRIGKVNPSDPSTGWTIEILADSPGHDPERYWKGFATQAPLSITVGAQVYAKPLASNWTTLESQLLSDLNTSLQPGESIDTATMVNSGDYLAFLILDSNNAPQATGIVYFKNGCLTTDEAGNVLLDRFEGQQISQMFAMDHLYKRNRNGQQPSTFNGIVTYPITACSLNATPSITLSRYTGERLTGDVSGHVVQLVKQVTGYEEIQKGYVYDAASAAADGLRGTLLKFYQVTEYPGVPSYDPEIGQGYTTSHFYNGVPKDFLTQEPVPFYSMLDGQLQTKSEYDNTHQLKTSATTCWSIQQTIATQVDGSGIRNIYGAIPQVVQIESIKEGISSIATIEYNPSSGKPVISQSFYHDSLGRKILTKTVSKSAYEVYPGMWQQQMLALPAQTSQWARNEMVPDSWELIQSEASTYKLWDLDDHPIDQWGVSSTYIANSPTPEDFIWWDETTTPVPSDGWQRTSRVLSRNKEGSVITAEDVEELKATTLYDTSQTFALATFGNATLDDGILYSSFEDYQENPWEGGSGGITKVDAFIGSQCYETVAAPGSFQDTNCWVNIKNPEQWYCFNGWIKTPDLPTTTVKLEVFTNVEGMPRSLTTDVTLTGSQWQPFQWNVNLSDLGVSGPVDLQLNIQLASAAGASDPTYLRIDQVLFAPLMSPFAATVYDLEKLREVGSVSANGASAQVLYDMWNGAYSSVGSNNQTSGLSSSYSVRQNPGYDPLTDAFPTTAPNMSFMVNGRERGFYDHLLSSESLENYTAVEGDLGDWRIEDSRLISNNVSVNPQLVIAGQSWKSLSVYAEVMPEAWAPGQSNPTQIMNLGVRESSGSESRFMVQWDGGAVQWNLLRWDGSSYINIESNNTIPWQPCWHLTVFEDRLLFTANGIPLFNVQEADLALSPHTVQFGGQDPSTSGTFFFQKFVVLEDVQLGFSYSDGAGRTLQASAVESSSQVIMTPAVYDRLGRSAIEFLPSRLIQGENGVTDIFAYQQNFITNGDSSGTIWSDEPVEGNINLYHSDAQGYPFSRTIYERSPLSRPLQSGGVGLKFAITPVANPHITQYQYGVNTADPLFLYNLPLYQYYVSTSTDPDGHQTERYTTTQGQVVGTIRRTAGGAAAPIKSSQVYDMKGQRIAGIPPQYYDGNSSPQGHPIPVNATQFTYDYWGRLIASSYPDSGASEVIYDITGRQRFSQNALGASQGYYFYTKYDILGRPTESGTATGTWDALLLQQKAKTDPTWPIIGTTVRQSIQYDGDSTTPWMVGRVWSSVTHNDDGAGTDTADIQLAYTYQSTGEVITQSQTATYNGVLDRHDEMSFTYNINGRLLTTTDSTIGVVEHFEINRLGQPIETRAEVVTGTGTKMVRATYTYNQLGDMEGSNLYTPSGTSLTDRAFNYLPNGWSQGATDSFMAEDIKYTEGRCTNPTEGYYNGSIAHNTVTYPGVTVPTPPSYDYCFTVDALNRVQGANNDGGEDYSWTFDDNSNFTSYIINDPLTSTTETRTYTTAANKNQLTNITSTIAANDRIFTYDAVGNTTTITDGTNPLLNIDYTNWSGKARSIDRPATNIKSVFDYGPEDGRVRKRIYTGVSPTLAQTVYNTGALEIETPVVGNTQTKRIIGTIGTGLLYRQEDETFYWVFADHLGSTRMIVNENGAVQRLFSYDIYGVPHIVSVDPNDDLAFYSLFTGQYYDAEIELYNYNARFYDPTLARFLQVDPLHQGFSPYVYVGDMPDEFTDPSGMSWQDTLGSFLSMFGGFAAIGGAIALTILTAGAATPVLIGVSVGAGALIGGGMTSLMYGAMHTGDGQFSAGGYFAQLGIGAGFGALGGGAAMGIGSLGLSAGRTLALDIGVNTVLGTAEGAAAAAASGDNIGAGAGFGALGGFAGSALLGAAGRGLALYNLKHMRSWAETPDAIGIGWGERTSMGHSSIVTRRERIEQVINEDGPIGLRALILSAKGSSLRTRVQKFEGETEFDMKLSKARYLPTSLLAATAARAHALSLVESSNHGYYNIFTNSCTSNIVGMVEKTGLRVPLLARTPIGLYGWWKGLGARKLALSADGELLPGEGGLGAVRGAADSYRMRTATPRVHYRHPSMRQMQAWEAMQ